METFDVSIYVTPTRFSGLAGVFLARALLQAAPKRPSARVRDSLVGVRERAEELRTVARDRMRVSPTNLRPLDATADAGWIGLRESLGAKARLEGTEAADRANALMNQVFPDGTGFLRLPLREQWAASQLHLERIDGEGMAAELDALVGAEYLPFIRRAHDALGEALGLGDTPPESLDSTALARATSDLAFAIAEYGRMLVGDLDRNDPASVAAFRTAVAPLDAHRRAAARKRGNGSTTVEEEPTAPEVDLEEPMPPVEPVA